MVGLGLADVLGDFRSRGPVDAANETLAVPSVGKTMLALLFGLGLELLFNLPPGLAKIDVGFCHKGRLVPVPVIKAVCAPPPFFEICQCGGHGPLDMVPRVLLLAKLVLQFQPCPFDMWKVVAGPVSDEGMDCLDMLDDHLVCRIQVLGLVLVVDDIRESACVEAQVGGKCLSKGLSVARSEPLSFDAPQSNRLDASAMEPESGAEIGEPQCAQFDAPLLVLLEPILQSGDAASATGLVINPEISHH